MSRRLPKAASARKWLALALLAVAFVGLAPEGALTQGVCSVYRTWQSGDSLTHSDLNSSFTTVGVTNLTVACIGDHSATVAQMQATTDPYASNAESLSTNLLGELERLRYKIAELGGTQYWYHRTASYGRAQGITATNNSVTPNTQFDLDADAVILGCSTCGYVTRVNPGAALTNNISTAGPAANGRDQAGAFTADTFVHFYWQWNGTTLATTSSATAPPTGPTLTTGYTHWAYAGAVYFTGGALRRVYVRGSWVSHAVMQNAINGATATVETAVSVSTIVPSNALNYKMSGRLSATATAGGSINIDIDLRVLSGSQFARPFSNHSTGASFIHILSVGEYTLPNVSQQFYYLATSVTGTFGGLTLDVTEYQVPNGD